MNKQGSFMAERWQGFSNGEIARAVELMIAPSDLAIREVGMALLDALGYSPKEVRHQLASGESFNDGPMFDDLANNPKILYPAIHQTEATA